MPGHRRNPSFGDAANLHQPSWVGQPDDDEDEDEIKRAANRASAIGTTAWFIMTSGVMLAMLLVSGSGPLGFWSTSAMPTGWDAPWWLTAIFAAEAYASFRRLFLKWKLGRSSVDILGQRKLAELASQRQRRLRHFTSMRLASSAPVDLIVAKFLELDELAAVRSLELGSNSSGERHSRGHNLGFLVTFTSMAHRQTFLGSPERASFLEFAEPYVEEWFVYDFESGVIDSK